MKISIIFLVSLIAMNLNWGTAEAKIPNELLKAMNVQVKHEMDGAYTYLAISQRMEDISFEGSAFWFVQQYYEEMNHARILMDFIQKQRGVVEFFPIELEFSPQSFSLYDAFTESLNLEETQTERIRNLFKLAAQLGSYETEDFLRFYLKEQVQEEDMFSTLLDRLELVKNDPHGLLMIDIELGKRPAAINYVAGGPLPLP